MSKQKFSIEQREAIYQAYSGKCMYCGKSMDIREFEIDHILPESLLNDKGELHKTLNEFGLLVDFNILGYENLLPTHKKCNGTKSDTVNRIFALHILEAAKKKPIIEDNLRKIVYRNKRIQTTHQICQLHATGDIEIRDIYNIIEQSSLLDKKIKINNKLYFEDGSELDKISVGDIPSLENISMADYFTLSKESASNPGTYDEIQVRTCNEFKDAIDHGYFPLCNVDMYTTLFIDQQCGLLKAARQAKLAEKSNVSYPYKGILDINLIPATFFPFITEDKKLNNLIKKSSYQDMVDKGYLVIKAVKQNMLEVAEPEDGFGQVLFEVFRADVNDDGYEEIYIFENCYAIGGTMRFGGSYPITIRRKNGNFVKVDY